MSRHRILAVDDDEALCRGTAKLLHARGYQVDIALSGREALDCLDRNADDIDVVVLDIRMPGMDGLETLRRIKSRFPQIEVIILTGYADVDYGMQAIRDGAFDFLVKPCDIDDLVERVRSACDLERIRRQPILWQRTCAGELILTFFIDLYPDDTLRRAVEILTSDRSKMATEILFVVDRQSRLLGYIDREALLKSAQAVNPQTEMTWDILSRRPDYLPTGTVAQIMIPDVISARPETPLAELAESMMQGRFRSIPVTDGERVVGIVRLRDVLRYLDVDAYEQYK